MLTGLVSRRVLLSLLVLLTACAGGPADRTADREREYRGRVLTVPWEKPAFALTDTDGREFDFRMATHGDLTLVFFGYTYCPDVCPVHMANLAAVLREMTPSVRRRIKVVFVTTDPARDTPERLRSWLDNFDTDFIGLRGPIDEVNRIQTTMGLPPAQRGEPDSVSGNYLVGHAAHVVAFTPDGLAHVVYPFGTRQADWAHDLPRLLEEEEWAASVP